MSGKIDLALTAAEKGTLKITLTFTDGAQAVSPKSLVWSLLTPEGAVINGREDVAVSAPGASYALYLSGADLARAGVASGFERRILAVTALYDAAGHTDLPITANIEFDLVHLLGV